MSVWKKLTSDVLGKNVDEKILETALVSLGLGLDKSVKTVKTPPA